MMEPIISALVSDIVSRVISLEPELFGRRQSTEAKMQRIAHMLIRVHSVVEEAKRRQITNDGILQWLTELINGEYKGQYLLATARSSNHDLDDEEAASAQAYTLSLVNPLKRVRIAPKDGRVHEIDRVHESLQRIYGDLKEFIMLLQDSQPIRRPLPTNIFVDGEMFGRHVEKERIINFLLYDCGQSRVELGVLPMVGDIGSGKATLVQHACDDVRVRSYFPVIILCSTYTITRNGGYVRSDRFYGTMCFSEGFGDVTRFL